MSILSMLAHRAAVQIDLPHYSPWGKVDCLHYIAEGLIVVSTERHGGFGLSATRYLALPPAYQIHHDTLPSKTSSKWFWFEEDDEACLVVDAFLDEINAERQRSQRAKLTREWVMRQVADGWPEQFESRYQRKLQPGESRCRDEILFYLTHANDLMVAVAWGDWHDNVPAGFVGVLAVKGHHVQNHNSLSPDIAPHYFLIEAEEYQRRTIAFIIDPARHAVWSGPHV